MLFTVLITLLKILSTTVPLLLSVAFFTVAERKIMGAIQRRRGPNVIGFVGLLQAIADGLKLLVKETILPSNSNLGIFLLAPVLSFILSGNYINNLYVFKSNKNLKKYGANNVNSSFLRKIKLKRKINVKRVKKLNPQIDCL